MQIWGNTDMPKLKPVKTDRDRSKTLKKYRKHWKVVARFHKNRVKILASGGQQVCNFESTE